MNRRIATTRPMAKQVITLSTTPATPITEMLPLPAGQSLSILGRIRENVCAVHTNRHTSSRYRIREQSQLIVPTTKCGNAMSKLSWINITWENKELTVVLRWMKLGLQGVTVVGSAGNSGPLATRQCMASNYGSFYASHPGKYA